MSNDMGPELKVEGEEEFRKQTEQLNRLLDTLETKMDAVTSSFGENDKSQKALSAQNKVLNKQIDLQKEALSNLKAGLSEAKDNYEENSIEVQGWEQSVNKATAQLNRMKNQLDENNEAMESSEEGTGKLGRLAAAAGQGFAVLGGAAASGAKLAAAGIASLAMEALKMDEGLNQGLASLSSTVQSGFLLPIGEQATGVLRDFVTQLGEGAELANGDVGLFMESFSAAFSEMLAGMNEALPQLVEGAVGIIGALGQGVIDNLPMLLESVMSILNYLGETLAANTGQLAAGAAQILMIFITGITEGLPALIETAGSILVSLATGISEALPTLMPAIVEAIVFIAQSLVENLDQLVAAAMILIQGLADGLLAALPVLIAALPGLIQAIVTFFVENLPVILNLGVQLIGQLAGGLVQALPQIGGVLVQIGSMIVDGLGSLVEDVVDIGGDIVRGLWRGIQALGKWLSDNVGGFFKGIIDGAKNLLGIHSPSTVFAGIGQYMAEGLGIGFTDQMRAVTRQIEGAIPTGINGEITGSVTGIKAPKADSAGISLMVHVENFINQTPESLQELTGRLADGLQSELLRRRRALGR